MSVTSVTLQVCAAEEASAKRACQELSARSDLAISKLDAEIATLRLKNEAEPCPDRAEDIKSLKRNIRRLVRHFESAETFLKRIYDNARELRTNMEHGFLIDWHMWSEQERVKRFEAGEMNYEVLRKPCNIKILSVGYSNRSNDRCFPPEDPPEEVVLCIAEEIIAGQYKKPSEGDLWKDWVATVKA
ncbi:uncharacterized protein LY89DRAFT_713807 [Mollisia scopiformis]|uniref:Uncharacterized protein n=1 Tax=Mollisia scopiformis TaxID=149040 RepID=A0A194XUD3_MOLSC|nr:uncharacterized protein LY89DRAFT_713807 [Mollisia scopiformis]KUJ23317.1 hypothetical protein LY89DRAFT_713807 [Mollisia scopiformis]